MSKALNKKISDLRSYLGLSQAAFAKPLNLSPTHIARFEKGTSMPSADVVDRICSAFSVDASYFTTDMPLEDAVEKTEQQDKDKAVAARLRTAREEKGWSQYRLAKESGVAQPVVNRVEAGDHLAEKQGRKLAETLEVGFDWLMEGNESRKTFPADEKMVEWLWENPEVREELWSRMQTE